MTDGRRSLIDEEIDRNLKRAFEELAAEPLPARFADLIDRLKAGERPAPSPDDDAG